MRELLVLHLAEHPYRPYTRDDFESVYKHLPTAFLDRQLRSVTPVVLDHLYMQLRRDGLSSYRIRKAHVLLSSAMTRARRWGWIATNPARDAMPPAEPKIETVTLTSDEARRFIVEADAVSDSFGMFVRLAAIVGARRGELLALQWRDLNDNDLRIRRSISMTKRSGLVVDEVKTGSKGVRTIALPPALVEMLHAHRVRQAEGALAAGIRLPASGWMFTHDYANPWYPTTPSHWAREACAMAGLDDTIQLRHLRNFVATEMLDAGYSVKQTAARLGHSRIATTGDRYAAWVRSRDEEAADMLGAKVL